MSLSMAQNFEIVCPCCDATLVIDRLSGAVLLHKAREIRQSSSLETMVSNLETQKQEAAKRFDRQLESQKDRGRILDERFREALQRADKSDKPMPNPLDLD